MRNGRLIERCKIPDKDKNKQAVKMLNTQGPLDPGSLGTDTGHFQDQSHQCAIFHPAGSARNGDPHTQAENGVQRVPGSALGA